MIKINTKIYTENHIHGITVNKKASKRLRLKMMDIEDNLGVENISDIDER